MGDGGLMLYLEHDFADVERVHPCDGRAFGTQHPVAEDCSESFAHVVGEVVEQLVVAVAQVDVDESAEGRIVEELTFRHLFVEHLPIVVVGDVADDVAVGGACLQNDKPGFAVASCSPCHLAECLEGAFVASEVW